jgi:uncharacterized tellurite resistance protein B-like protein
MFQRLLNRLGAPANQQEAGWPHDHELQLAAAVLLFGVMPVDYAVTRDEGGALFAALTNLFHFSPERCRRMIARAAAVHVKDSTIMPAATLLKARTPETFRQQLLHEAQRIMQADGVIHVNEVDLFNRLQRLLGLLPPALRQSA